MDPPPPPPTTNTTTPTTTVTDETLTNTTNTFAGGGGKLRLMCSYGGHIIPRPHDKSLSYVGGETRIVVIDRTTTLSDLFSRLSKTLLNGRKFGLKYQLPNEDLDSLITVSTDEDLDNMIEEYDRLLLLSSSSGKAGRIRLFLFPERPDGPVSVGPGGPDLVGDSWFVSSLNGLDLRRGFSDPTSVNCLLGLDNGGGCGGGLEVRKISNVEVQSVPDSPIVETNSSFGSTSSTPSTANLAPIRVHVEENGVRVSEAKVDGVRVSDVKADGVRVSKAMDNGFTILEVKDDLVRVSESKLDGVSISEAKVDGVRVSEAKFNGVGGIEEQFGQFSIGVNNNDNKKQVDDGFVAPVVGPTVTAVPMVAIGVVGNGSEFVPQTVGQPVNSAQAQQKQMGGGELGFSDSFASDNSLSNSATQVSNRSNQLPPTTIDLNGHIQVPNSGYTFTPQYDPQHHHQLFHYQHQQPLQPPHHPPPPPPPPPGAVPLSTFYQMHPHQQYQVYYVPVGQAPAYHLHAQRPPNVGEKVAPIPSSHPQPPQNPNLITTSTTRVATVSAPSLVQSQAQPQMQQQYMGYSKIHHQSQSIAPNTAPNAAYAYELVESAHPQMYYTRPTVSAQYQGVTSSANMVLPNCSMPIGNDDLKQRILSS